MMWSAVTRHHFHILRQVEVAELRSNIDIAEDSPLDSELINYLVLIKSKTMPEKNSLPTIITLIKVG